MFGRLTMVLMQPASETWEYTEHLQTILLSCFVLPPKTGRQDHRREDQMVKKLSSNLPSGLPHH